MVRQSSESARDAVPVAAVATEAHTLHVFELDGRPVEVDVFVISRVEWERRRPSLGPLYSAVPLGRCRVRLVRLTS